MIPTEKLTFGFQLSTLFALIESLFSADLLLVQKFSRSLVNQSDQKKQFSQSGAKPKSAVNWVLDFFPRLAPAVSFHYGF